MAGPMDGVRVVELTVWVAGPACAGVLADWGADVVKVEPPDGDPARTYAQMLGGDMPTNPVFELDNRSKRSVAVDLRSDAGRAIALDLLDRADVFVTNIRAAALARLGLDYETVHARAPSLVYGMILGYGLEGPDADAPAYDIGAYWSRSGIASLLTPPGGDPPFQRGGFGDHQVALTAAGAISAALFARERSGDGQLVTTSLIRQGTYAIGFDLNVALMWGRQIGLGARSAMPNPAMNNYRAGDGRRFWVIGQVAERHWPPLARAVGHPEWLDDERFATRGGRARNARELIGLLDAVFATKTLAEWAAVFATEPDFFWAPINTVDDLLVDPQFLASGALVSVPDGRAGTTMLASPSDFSGTPWAPRGLAPTLGEHTRDVLSELGRTDAEIGRLVEGAVVVCGDQPSS
ncbi:MAG: CaiB/BaiF CoA transferase family protein [Acidimicrobiales bacterium]